MDLLSPITFWCDVLLEDSSMVEEVESFHDSSKPYKIFKTFSNFPFYFFQLSINITTYLLGFNVAIMFIVWDLNLVACKLQCLLA